MSNLNLNPINSKPYNPQTLSLKTYQIYTMIYYLYIFFNKLLKSEYIWGQISFNFLQREYVKLIM